MESVHFKDERRRDTCPASPSLQVMPSTEPTNTLSLAQGTPYQTVPLIGPLLQPQTGDSEQQLQRWQCPLPSGTLPGPAPWRLPALAPGRCRSSWVKDSQHRFPPFEPCPVGCWPWDVGIESRSFFSKEIKVNSLPEVFKGAGRWLAPWGTQSWGSFWPLRKLPGP